MRLQYTKSFLYIPSASFRFEYAEEASSWDVSGEKIQSIKLRIRRRMHLSSLSTEKRVYIERVIPLSPLSKWMNHSILKRRKVTNKGSNNLN